MSKFNKLKIYILFKNVNNLRKKNYVTHKCFEINNDVLVLTYIAQSQKSVCHLFIL